MNSPMEVLTNALRDAYDSLFELIVINVLWLAFTLLIVTAPAAAAGLYSSTFLMARGRTGSASLFFEGMRQHLWAGYRWALLELGVSAVLGVNFWFYGQVGAQWAAWVQGIALGLLVLWLALWIFTFPLYLAQKERRLLTAVRNSLVLYIRRPGYCLSLIAFLLLLAALSTLFGLPWILFTVSFAGMLISRFMIAMMESLGYHLEG